MTRLTIFTIFDSKAQAYLQPFFSANAETAQREFTTAVNGEGQFNKFAEDYSMFQLGTFDQESGAFILEASPIHICNAITLKQAQSADAMRLQELETAEQLRKATNRAKMNKSRDLHSVDPEYYIGKTKETTSNDS